MSETNGKTVNNNDIPEKENLEDVKGTDFVEPCGKGRKILKWILTGVAAAVTFVGGVLIGKSLDGKKTEDDEAGDEAQAA